MLGRQDDRHLVPGRQPGQVLHRETFAIRIHFHECAVFNCTRKSLARAYCQRSFPSLNDNLLACTGQLFGTAMTSAYLYGSGDSHRPEQSPVPFPQRSTHLYGLWRDRQVWGSGSPGGVCARAGAYIFSQAVQVGLTSTAGAGATFSSTMDNSCQCAKARVC